MSRSLRASALAAVKGSRRKVNLQPSPALVDALTKHMISVFARTEKLTKRKPSVDVIKASSFRDDLARAADSFDMDLSVLTDKFKPVAKTNLKKTLAELTTVINNELAHAIKDDATVKETSRRIAARLDQFGVSPVKPTYLETVVRTHSQLAYNGAHFLQLAGDTDIQMFQYVTVGDDRVRPEHEVLDGTTRNRTDAIWKRIWPPNGWNCRCQVIALYEKSRQTRLPRKIEIEEGFDQSPADYLL